jgi:hypothetical protein
MILIDTDIHGLARSPYKFKVLGSIHGQRSSPWARFLAREAPSQLSSCSSGFLSLLHTIYST